MEGVSDVAPADTDATGEVKEVGPFRIYLGAAPGVGKTYAMLSEGHRRRGRGVVVVGRAPVGSARAAGNRISSFAVSNRSAVVDCGAAVRQS